MAAPALNLEPGDTFSSFSLAIPLISQITFLLYFASPIFFYITHFPHFIFPKTLPYSQILAFPSIAIWVIIPKSFPYSYNLALSFIRIQLCIFIFTPPLSFNPLLHPSFPFLYFFSPIFCLLKRKIILNRCPILKCLLITSLRKALEHPCII